MIYPLHLTLRMRGLRQHQVDHPRDREDEHLLLPLLVIRKNALLSLLAQTNIPNPCLIHLRLWLISKTVLVNQARLMIHPKVPNQKLTRLEAAATKAMPHLPNVNLGQDLDLIRHHQTIPKRGEDQEDVVGVCHY